MTTHISGTTGVDLVQDDTLVAADIKTGQTVGIPLMQLFTAQATTSGTFKDFPNIPSWAKKITVIQDGVSLSATSFQIVQLGAGSIQTTGYASGGASTGGSNSVTGLSTAIGLLAGGGGGVTNAFSGACTIINTSGNTWVSSTAGGFGNVNFGVFAGGRVTLSGPLTQLRLTTLTGTDTFDAGSVNILVEGYQ